MNAQFINTSFSSTQWCIENKIFERKNELIKRIWHRVSSLNQDPTAKVPQANIAKLCEEILHLPHKRLLCKSPHKKRVEQIVIYTDDFKKTNIFDNDLAEDITHLCLDLYNQRKAEATHRTLQEKRLPQSHLIRQLKTLYKQCPHCATWRTLALLYY